MELTACVEDNGWMEGRNSGRWIEQLMNGQRLILRRRTFNSEGLLTSIVRRCCEVEVEFVFFYIDTLAVSGGWSQVERYQHGKTLTLSAIAPLCWRCLEARKCMWGGLYFHRN